MGGAGGGYVPHRLHLRSASKTLNTLLNFFEPRSIALCNRTKTMASTSARGNALSIELAPAYTDLRAL